jgi:hypothetical protein
MRIDAVYSEVHYLLNKNQRGNGYSIDEFNRACEMLDIDYLKLKMGLPEEYSPDFKQPRQAWEVSHAITEAVGHLKIRKGKDSPPLYINSLGIGILDEEYLHISTVYTDYSDVEVVNDDDFSGRLNMTLKKPTHKNPICRILGKTLEFEPRDLNSSNLTYIRKPVAAFYDYKIVLDEPVFLAPGEVHDGSVLAIGTVSRSLDFDWPYQTHSDLVNILVSYGSKNLRDGASSQLSEARKDKGI